MASAGLQPDRRPREKPPRRALFSVFNRQQARPVDGRLLRRLIANLLNELAGLPDIDLAVHLVDSGEMAELNQTHLRHHGSTDVITLDYSEPGGTGTTGEIYVCVEEAVMQASQHRTIWQSELARYLIHGLLHLRGFDDTRPAARRQMKREENRLLRELRRRFPLRNLARKPRLQR